MQLTASGSQSLTRLQSTCWPGVDWGEILSPPHSQAAGQSQVLPAGGQRHQFLATWPLHRAAHNVAAGSLGVREGGRKGMRPQMEATAFL